MTRGQEELRAICSVRGAVYVAERVRMRPADVLRWCSGQHAPARPQRLALQEAFGIEPSAWGAVPSTWALEHVHERCVLLAELWAGALLALGRPELTVREVLERSEALPGDLQRGLHAIATSGTGRMSPNTIGSLLRSMDGRTFETALGAVVIRKGGHDRLSARRWRAEVLRVEP